MVALFPTTRGHAEEGETLETRLACISTDRGIQLYMYLTSLGTFHAYIYTYECCASGISI